MTQLSQFIAQQALVDAIYATHERTRPFITFNLFRWEMVDDDKKATTMERRNMKTEKFRIFFSASSSGERRKEILNEKLFQLVGAFSVEMDSMRKRKLRPQGAGENEQKNLASERKKLFIFSRVIEGCKPDGVQRANASRSTLRSSKRLYR